MSLAFHDFIIKTRPLTPAEFFIAAETRAAGDQSQFIQILKTKIEHQHHVKINFHI